MIRHATSVDDCLTAKDLCWYIECNDVLKFLWSLPPRSVDLIFGSPPYETRRPYSNGFALKGEAWVAWMVEVFKASLRACRGMVAYVVEGTTSKFRYSAVPALLMADLHRAGVCLRKPPAFYRRGIMGSGGPDGWRNDWEFVVCATNGGRLEWSDNTATGHPPRWAPGGQPSHRTKDGSRVNRGSKDETNSQSGRRPKLYVPPRLANPGNVITCNVGGGHMGSKLAHLNQAPFPESLVYPFVVSYCPYRVCCDCETPLPVNYAHGWQEVRMVPRTNGGIRQKILQQGVRSKGNVAAQGQGPYNDTKGVCVSQSAGSFVGDKDGVYDGAPGCDGEASGPYSSKRRGGSSQKRNSQRQSFRESSVNEKDGARFFVETAKSDCLSKVRAHDCKDQICMVCGSGRSRPGVCLDCFSGSATTGAVSVMNGRRYLGCDIDQRQVELGARRMAEANERMAANDH